jgi:hypothetical protein
MPGIYRALDADKTFSVLVFTDIVKKIVKKEIGGSFSRVDQ